MDVYHTVWCIAMIHLLTLLLPLVHCRIRTDVYHAAVDRMCIETMNIPVVNVDGFPLFLLLELPDEF